MPQFTATLSDGREIDFEADQEPSHDELLSAVESWKPDVKPLSKDQSEDAALVSAGTPPRIKTESEANPPFTRIIPLNEGGPGTRQLGEQLAEATIGVPFKPFTQYLPEKTKEAILDTAGQLGRNATSPLNIATGGAATLLGLLPESITDSNPLTKPLAPEIGTGIGRGAYGLAEGLLSPVGIATLGMGSLPVAAQRAVSLAFATQMTLSVPELATELGTEFGKPVDERDTARIAELLTAAAGTAAFTTLAGKHGLAPRPNPTRLSEIDREARGNLSIRDQAALVASRSAPLTAQALADTAPIVARNLEPLPPPSQPAPLPPFRPAPVEQKPTGAPFRRVTQEPTEQPAVTFNDAGLPRVAVQIQQADGTVVSGEMNGYYMADAPSIGYPSTGGKLTHGLLRKGDKILTPIPTPEEWAAIKKPETTPETKPSAPAATDTPATPVAETTETIVGEMIESGRKGIEGLRNRISNVKYGDAQRNEITFDFDGKPQVGTLNGRNRDLLLGSSPESDVGIATRVLVDGDSKPSAPAAAPAVEAPTPTGAQPGGEPIAAPKWTSATAGEKRLTLKELSEGKRPKKTGEAGFIDVSAIADEVYDMAKRAGAAVGKAMRGVRDIKNEALKLPATSDLRRSVLGWSAKLQKSFSEAAQAQKDINKRVPNLVRRAGITNWIQAGGDAKVLQDRLNATKAWVDPSTGKPHPQRRKLVAGYEAALKLTPDEIAVANDAKAAYDALGKRGQAEDILNSFLDNYVTQIWDLGKGSQFAGSRTLRDRFQFSKARTFDSYFAGEQAGFVPRGNKDIGKLLPVYIHEMNSVIAARQLVADMASGVASDGRPLVSPRGIEIPADAELDRPGLVIPRVPKESGTADYKVLENQPALNDWRWLSTDEAGNNRFIKSDLALHPEALGRLRAALGKSAIREWYQSPGSLAVALPKAMVKALDNFQGFTKQTMFGMLSPFHQVQEGTHAVGHRVNPFFSIPKIDLVKNPAQMDASRHGLMLQPDRASQQHFMQGVSAGGLIQRIPVLGNLSARYSDYLFHQYIPGLKFKTYEKIFGRNSHVFAKELAAGTVKPEDVKILSAEQANAAYGHLNYADLGRNPTIQHVMQLGLLAPDFLEARGRFTMQAIKGGTGAKVGREQMLALGALALTQAAAAWMAAQLTGGEWDDKHPFEMKLDGRRYTLRSIPEDVSGLLHDWRRFLNSRVSPVVTRPSLQLMTGRDWAGERTTKSGKQVFGVGKEITADQAIQNAATAFVPVSMRGFEWIKDFTGQHYKNGLSPLEQIAGSAGLRISHDYKDKPK